MRKLTLGEYRVWRGRGESALLDLAESARLAARASVSPGLPPIRNSIVTRNDLDTFESSKDSHNVWLSRTLSIVTKSRHQSHPLSNTERRILNRSVGRWSRRREDPQLDVHAVLLHSPPRLPRSDLRMCEALSHLTLKGFETHERDLSSWRSAPRTGLSLSLSLSLSRGAAKRSSL